MYVISSQNLKLRSSIYKVITLCPLPLPYSNHTQFNNRNKTTQNNTPDTTVLNKLRTQDSYEKTRRKLLYLCRTLLCKLSFT